MCLNIAKKQPKKRNKYYYKFFTLGEHDELVAPIRHYVFKIGKNLPNGKITKTNLRNKILSGGCFHAMSTYQLASHEYEEYSEVILKFPLQSKNIICYGEDGDIALKSITITKSQYQRAVRKLKKLNLQE